MVASIYAESGAESILQIVSASALKADTVNVEPASPESAGPETTVTVDDAASIVAVPVIDLALDVEIYHANDTIVMKEGGERINDWIELGNHGQSIAHSKEVGPNLGLCIVRIIRVVSLRYGGLWVEYVHLVLFELEVPCILANHVNVIPT